MSGLLSPIIVLYLSHLLLLILVGSASMILAGTAIAVRAVLKSVNPSVVFFFSNTM